MKKKIELLAPARDKKMAFAAINAGADAIYIGADSFGARKNAGNTIGDIKEIIEYAHKFYVKVFVTINTILTDNEMLKVAKLIQELYEIKTDAIIVQDMGILELAVKNKLPPIPIHISTQCDNRTLQKVKFFEKTGIPRVILARELSVSQIKEIAENCSDIEIETFIHGALCVSYSGQCYLSSFIGGRSSNRGECAQPCRKKYSLCKENGEVIVKNKYLLCLKDFNASQYLEELVNAGVKSFKIEGRLKDQNYVKNVVLYYRNLIDKIAEKTSSGKIYADFEPDINKSFNRGYTSYFLNNREKCYNFSSPKTIGEKLGQIVKSLNNCYIVKTSSKINLQDGLCYFTSDGELKGFAINKIENNRIYPNNYVSIPENTEFFRNYNAAFEKILNNSKINRKIGMDIFVQDNIITVEDEDNNRIQFPLAGGEHPKKAKVSEIAFVKQMSKTGNSDFYVNSIKVNQQIDFYPIAEINKIRRECTKLLMETRLKNYPLKLASPLNYADYPLAVGDYRLNIYNSLAKEFYKNCKCRIKEWAFEDKIPDRSVELMRTKHCIKWALGMCKSPGKLFLIDEKSKKYPLDFDCKNCEMTVMKPN